ncbi:MAG: tetratricopeptide repeat protein [Alphaproteobacteria bacterium HGW-Alphaproteobacteria-2]|nr:MAG: tetratricopeptide repeat protein [Alphaproteobacteria bacterium HGW-Alphaproteobacteria-2]
MRGWFFALIGAFLASACQIVPPAAPPPQLDLLDDGHALMARGDYEGALASYQRALVRGGVTADAQSAIGSANLRLGRIDQAERWLRAAVAQDPDYAAAWNNLGVVLVEQGDYAEASLAFRRAFALVNGDSEEMRENLRLALAKSENPSYDAVEEQEFELVRRGGGAYVLLPTLGQRTER